MAATASNVCSNLNNCPKHNVLNDYKSGIAHQTYYTPIKLYFVSPYVTIKKTINKVESDNEITTQTSNISLQTEGVVKMTSDIWGERNNYKNFSSASKMLSLLTKMIILFFLEYQKRRQTVKLYLSSEGFHRVYFWVLCQLHLIIKLHQLVEFLPAIFRPTVSFCIDKILCDMSSLVHVVSTV